MRGYLIAVWNYKMLEKQPNQKIAVTIYSLKCNSVPTIQATSTVGIPPYILSSSYLWVVKE